MDENQIYSSARKPAKDGGHPGYDKRSPLRFICPFVGKRDLDDDGSAESRRIACCIEITPGDAEDPSNHAGDVHIWAEGGEFEYPPEEKQVMHTRGADLDKTRNEGSQENGLQQYFEVYPEKAKGDWRFKPF